jgi:hypothetical protein
MLEACNSHCVLLSNLIAVSNVRGGRQGCAVCGTGCVQGRRTACIMFTQQFPYVQKDVSDATLPGYWAPLLSL